MTKREIASLVVKLIGVYCLVQFVPSLIFLTLNAAKGAMNPIVLLLAGSLPVVTIGFYVAIIRMSEAIALRLVPEDADAKIDTGLDGDAIVTIAFATVGLLVLSSAIHRLAALCANYVLLSEQGVSSSLHGSLVGTIVQVAIGLVLFVRVDGLVKLWHNLRTAR